MASTACSRLVVGGRRPMVKASSPEAPTRLTISRPTTACSVTDRRSSTTGATGRAAIAPPTTRPPTRPAIAPRRIPMPERVPDDQAKDRAEQRADGQDRERRPAADRDVEEPQPAGGSDAGPDRELGEVVARGLADADDEDHEREPADASRARGPRWPPAWRRSAVSPGEDRQHETDRADRARDEVRVPLPDVADDLREVDQRGAARPERGGEQQRHARAPRRS